MPSIDTKPHIEAKQLIMWGLIVVVLTIRIIVFTGGNMYVSKEGLFTD